MMASLTQKNGLHHAQLKLDIYIYISLLTGIVKEMLQRIHRKDEEELCLWLWLRAN
jgi:hypothetical protein